MGTEAKHKYCLISSQLFDQFVLLIICEASKSAFVENKNKPDKPVVTLMRGRSPRQIAQEQEEVWWLSPRSLSASCFTGKKPPFSVRLGLLWKESVLSHRALNREVLCGHTHSAGPYLSGKHLRPRPSEGLWGFVSAAADQTRLEEVQWREASSSCQALVFLKRGFFIQGRGHHRGLRERKGAQHSGDFLFGIGISVFDVGGPGKVPSSVSIWESRHQSPLVSFGAESF